MLNKRTLNKKSSGLFSDGFEFSAEADLGGFDAWGVSQDIIRSASKRQVCGIKIISVHTPEHNLVKGIMCVAMGKGSAYKYLTHSLTSRLQ